MSNEEVTYTTKVKTKDGKVYNIGERQYVPYHNHPREATCPGCQVVNAWMEKEEKC